MSDESSFNKLAREFQSLEDDFHRSSEWSYRAAILTQMARVVQQIETITNRELGSIMGSALGTIPSDQRHALIRIF